MISVDGDTSTNDMVCIMANGKAENDIIDSDSADFETFKQALMSVSVKLSRLIAGDGEGCTRLFEVTAYGAASKEEAKILLDAMVKQMSV